VRSGWQVIGAGHSSTESPQHVTMQVLGVGQTVIGLSTDDATLSSTHPPRR
jgi:hypothetical protein